MADLTLNEQALANIAEVLQGRELTGDEIVDGVMAMGYRHRPYVLSMVQRALINGKLIRTNYKRPYRYRIAESLGELPPATPRVGRQRMPATERRDIAPALAPEWSAAAPAPGLSPSIGLVCEEEVMPPEVAVIFDSLDRRFHEIFGNVE